MESLEMYGIEKGKNNEEAIYSLALIYNIIHNEISTFLKKYNLTPGKFNILVAIKRRGGKKGIRQVEVSKHLIVTPSNMTKLIDKLEKDGLVARSALEGDRRVNITKITKKGSDLIDKAWVGYHQILVDLMNKLDQKDQKQLSSLLMQWLGAL